MSLRRRQLGMAAAALCALPLAAGPSATATERGAKVVLTVDNLRNAKGVVRACLAPAVKAFHKCRGQNVQKLVAPAGKRVVMTFRDVAPGTYAIALLHDENNNDKADAALGMMPTEGFGFSRDAPVSFGPPDVKDAAFSVSDVTVRQTVKMRYML